MKTQTLKVISIEDAVDKNKKPYRKIGVSTPSAINADTENGVMSVKVAPRLSSFNAWGESYLNSRKGGADFGFDVAVGDLLAGTIVKRSCLATLRDADGNITGFADHYVIPNDKKEDTKASSYSAVILANSADEVGFEQAIRDAFWSQDKPLANDPRVLAITGPARLTEPVKVAAGVAAEQF